MTSFLQVKATFRCAVAFGAAIFVSACTTTGSLTPDSAGVYDPYEQQNRSVHAFNKSVDRTLFRPTANGYATVVPNGVRDSVNNFSNNLAMPAAVVNSLLQGDLKDAGLATVRFAMNSTIGLGGFIDAASEFKVADVDTDFGETLSVWGVNEGAYIELPFLGPSTQRAAVGKVVDLFTNPLTHDIDEPEKYYPPATGLLAQLNNRAKFGDSVDSVLYDSADSYAQARLIYLQNRRFQLGTAGTDSLDPYSDPYEDPYAE